MADWLKPIIKVLVQLLIKLLEHFLQVDIDGNGKVGE